MTIETSWLIGSTYIPETSMEIDGDGSYVWPAGYYYLRHTTAALSMIDTLDGMFATAGVSGHSVFIARDRKVRIIADVGWGVSVVWPSALRTLFGFDANLVAADTQTAPDISPLLWSAGKPQSPQESPFGVAGRSVYDTRLGTAPDGSQVADSHNTQVVNTYNWNHVAYTRFQTAAPGIGGEYVTFFDRVLRNAYKFFLYSFVTESLTTDATAVTWPTGTDKLGPYGYRPARGAMSWDFQRSSGHQNTGRFNQVSLDCLITTEWT